MQAPIVYLNGQQITGLATDRAPVLGGVELVWGTDNDVEHADPAQLNFSILFRDGVHAMPDMQRGAEIELVTYGETIFAGRVRSCVAVPGALQGSLEMRLACSDYIADLQGAYLSCDYPAQSSGARWAVLQAEFSNAGWVLAPNRSHDFGESRSVYNSIQYLTVLTRYLAANGRLTYWDNSRRVSGMLQRRVTTGERASTTGANALRADDDGHWYVEYTAKSSNGFLVSLSGRNVKLPEWSQAPGAAINSVQIGLQSTTVDENGQATTNLVEHHRNDMASIDQYGRSSVEVEASAGQLTDPQITQLAKTWYRSSTNWNIESAELYDTELISNSMMLNLLSTSTRARALLVITEAFYQQPDPESPTSIRAALLGGTYTWTGKKWEMELILGRNQAFTATNRYRFTDISAARSHAIRNGRADTVGHFISFADFRQISRKE